MFNHKCSPFATNCHGFHYDVNMTKRSDINLEMGGMVREDGLQRPLPAGELLVPGMVELGDCGIHWASFDPSAGRPHTVRFRPGVLDSFIRLRTASDAEILKFARRWGVLELCAHVLPACHSKECLPMSHGAKPYCEPTAAWRRHADLMYTSLYAASQVILGQSRPAIDWEPVTGLLTNFRDAELFKRTGLSAERSKLEAVLNVLSGDAGVRPVVRFQTTPPRVEFIGGSRIGYGLYGALVAQLMLACVASDGVEFCSSCGMPYAPSRRPNPARRKYCDTCRRTGIPRRDASRDYRARFRGSQ
jgi:hypothetical protein